ncbi:hypothetical protein T4A_12896, partial [Trichinella pseudospiralis]
ASVSWFQRNPAELAGRIQRVEEFRLRDHLCGNATTYAKHLTVDRHLSKPLTGRSTNLKSGGSRPSHQETHDTMHFKMPSNVAAAIERIRKFTTALTNVPTFHLLENDTRKDAYVAMEDLTATLLRLVAVDN